MKTKVVVQKNPLLHTDINDIQIPDLWHIALDLPEPAQAKVLIVWNLCHSLREHIQLNS